MWTDIYALWTRDESHGNTAWAALPRLLKSFPAKATVNQVFYLNCLIPAALKHVDGDELAAIVHRKLASASLRIGHRLRWLATGMFLGDPLLGEQLDHFLSGGSDSRAREFAAFLKVRAVSKRVRSLPDRSLAMLVRRLGGYYGPVSGGVPGYMSFEVDEALQTDGLIRTALDALSYRRTPEATELLQALLDDENLAAWREPISEASDAQRVVRLDAEFEPPTILNVASVLMDGQPDSAADLAALAVDRILAIGEQVRDGDADAWRPFWSEGERGKPNTPKIEPSCQQALLLALRPKLPERVRVEAEVRHAGDKRSDLQISFGDFAVPVETKMSSSRDLWDRHHRSADSPLHTRPEIGRLRPIRRVLARPGVREEPIPEREAPANARRATGSLDATVDDRGSTESLGHRSGCKSTVNGRARIAQLRVLGERGGCRLRWPIGRATSFSSPSPSPISLHPRDDPRWFCPRIPSTAPERTSCWQR